MFVPSNLPAKYPKPGNKTKIGPVIVFESANVMADWYTVPSGAMVNLRIAGTWVPSTGTSGETGKCGGPSESALHGYASHDSACSVSRPAILLPDANEARGIARVNGYEWFHRPVVIIDACFAAAGRRVRAAATAMVSEDAPGWEQPRKQAPRRRRLSYLRDSDANAFTRL